MAQFPPPELGDSYQDIEVVGDVHVAESSGSQGNPAHPKGSQPSLETIMAIITMEWGIIVFVLKFPIKGDDDNSILNALSHQHPKLFYFIIIIGATAFYLMFMWWMMLMGGFRPPIARTLILLVLVLGVLVFTVLLYALFSWIVWIVFAPIIWVMLVTQGCQWAIRWTDKICTWVLQRYKWATRWTDKIRTRYGDRFCCLPISSPSRTTTQTVAVIVIIVTMFI